MKINIIGNLLGNDGYASHTRNLANALYPIADCRLATQLVEGWERMVNDAEFDMVTKPERKEDWNVIVAIPHMWKMFLGQGKNCGYMIWEGDKIPKSWINECLNPKINLIFIASEHTKQAILNTLNDLSEEECKILLEKLL